jgi:hypothetical protein
MKKGPSRDESKKLRTISVNELFPAEELARRAAMFGVIANLIKDWDDPAAPTPITSAFARGTSVRHQPLLPRIKVRNHQVICNNTSLDLARRPMTLRLFEVFCNAPNHERSRDDLLMEVYRIKDLNSHTERYVESVYNNGVKLISRARILATTHLSFAVSHGIEWFVYDQERKIWCLYRLRNEYLSDHLGRFAHNFS